jgi:hypothetical protein
VKPVHHDLVRKRFRRTPVVLTFLIAFMTVLCLPPYQASAQTQTVVTSSRNLGQLPGTEKAVVTGTGFQLYPRISGNILAYTSDYPDYEASDVYYYDFVSGTNKLIAGGQGFQQLPSVSNGRVAYSDNNNGTVNIYTVATGVTGLIAAGYYASLSGNLVAWQSLNGYGVLYGKNLTTGEQRQMSNSSSYADQTPSVASGIIAWQRCDSYSCSIRAYDWILDKAIQVTTDMQSSNQWGVATDGKKVVYRVFRAAPYGIAVCAFDLKTSEEKCLPTDTNTYYWNYLWDSPLISGDNVLFTDYYDSTNTLSLKLWHLPTDTIYNVTQEPVGVNVDIEGNRIFYISNRSGDYDIYMYEFQTPPIIEVSPTAYDFGTVKVGSSKSAIVTLSNTGSDDMSVSSIAIAGSCSNLKYLGQSSMTLVSRQTVDLNLAFNPTYSGTCSGSLMINSNDPKNPVIQVVLNGTGDATEPPPADQIASILTFFDSSVANGTLQGLGSGNSAAGRLKALRNMIVATGDLLAKGYTNEACRQLWDLYEKMDGLPRPPDFVTGSAAPALAAQVQQLISYMACPRN